MLNKYLPLVLLFFLSGVAVADEVADNSVLISGSSSAGKTLYDAQCMVCHGPGGASVVPTQPILSGMAVEYLVVQTRRFRDGQRHNAIMTPMAAALSDEDINNLAIYLSEQPPVIAGAADTELARSAEQLYRGGEIKSSIPACAACHGPTGRGVPPHYPLLSGQHATYIESSLRNYAAGKRPGKEMQQIASRLSEEQIKALAAYISGLAP